MRKNHRFVIGLWLRVRGGNVVKIIDRVKNLFKLSQGEYVAPDKVQKILMNSKYVNQLFLHGDSLYNYAIAIVYPDLNECVAFLKDNKKMGDIDYDKITFDDLCGNKTMEDEIVKDCNIVGRKLGLKGFELPKKIHLVKEPFSVESQIVTPTLKIRRHNAKKYFMEEIKKLYEI